MKAIRNRRKRLTRMEDEMMCAKIAAPIHLLSTEINNVLIILTIIHTAGIGHFLLSKSNMVFILFDCNLQYIIRKSKYNHISNILVCQIDLRPATEDTQLIVILL